MDHKKIGQSLIDQAWDMSCDTTVFDPSFGFIVSKSLKPILRKHQKMDRVREEFASFPVFYTEKEDVVKAINLKKTNVLVCGSGAADWLAYHRISSLKKIPLAKFDPARAASKDFSELVVLSMPDGAIPLDVYKFLNNCGFGFKYIKEF